MSWAVPGDGAASMMVGLRDGMGESVSVIVMLL